MDKETRGKLLRLGIISCLLILVFVVVFQQKDNNLHLTFCDIGQGDAILASYKNKQVLIDGGKFSENKKLLLCLQSEMPFWDRKIEVVVNTHPDEDHFGGLVEILKRYRVGYFLHSGFNNPDNWQWQELKKKLFEQKVCTKMITAGESFRVDKLYFEGLFPRLTKAQVEKDLQANFFDEARKCPVPEFNFLSDNLNNNSVVLMLHFEDFDVLLTGDLEQENEKVLVWREELNPLEILKVSHHGAKTGTTEELLRAIRPKLAVISVGENSFGHPTVEVLARLKEFGIPVKRTDQDGAVKIISNGIEWWLK